MSFLSELKRRNVIRVGIAYIVVAWLIMQFADVVLNNIEAPGWVFQVIMLMLAIGLPLVLIFAWAFEMTPEGLKKEKDVDRSQSITPHTGKKLNNTILVLMALAIVYLLFDKFSGPEKGPDTFSQEATNQITQAGDEKMYPAPFPEPAKVVSRQSIAVLPFDNRSRNVDDEYFTEGIHDDLLTSLARIASLKVISRTSVSQYQDTEKTIPQIAAELGVATIMEGAVQRSGNTVRINVQLIDATTDEHLWAEIFDREMTAENLFAIQSEISQKIANALEATLSPAETQRLNDFPTQSMEAYNAYLRGRQLLPQRNSKDLVKAMGSFEEAVKLDPNFALAWVGMAESATLLRTHGSNNPTEQIPMMKNAVGRALDIDPNLGEAYVSQGALFESLGQREQAEAAYRRAIELSPNYATAYQWYAELIRNTNDRLQESLALFNKAAQLDPLSAIIKQGIAQLYSRMGRYDESEATYRQLLVANPEFSSGMVDMAWNLYGNGEGRLDEAIILTRDAHRVDPGRFGSLLTEFAFWFGLGDLQSAQVVYQQMEDLDAESRWLPATKARLNVRQGRYAAAKEEGLFLSRKFNSRGAQRQAFIILARTEAYEQAREILNRNDPRYFDPEQWPDILNGGTNNACIVGLTLLH
ncbi:tetratricopeptide repeat protein, partial [Pseudomonadota bacterium]